MKTQISAPSKSATVTTLASLIGASSLPGGIEYRNNAFTIGDNLINTSDFWNLDTGLSSSNGQASFGGALIDQGPVHLSQIVMNQNQNDGVILIGSLQTVIGLKMRDKPT